ncbi:hypothetical protein SDC9_204355 [bioreactor metagenome]|uniref:Uncharacterized protein n=1 Tax=bioreactor metagenome TaxID=1076179 RepID=A0A645IYZ7_9ZZZZ
MDFIIRAFYSRYEVVSETINAKVGQETLMIYDTYFSNINFSKLRDDVDPKEIYQMLTWMTDGYIHEWQRTGQSIGIDDMMKKYRLWSAYLRRLSYKEEHLK